MLSLYPAYILISKGGVGCGRGYGEEEEEERALKVRSTAKEEEGIFFFPLFIIKFFFDRFFVPLFFTICNDEEGKTVRISPSCGLKMHLSI